ncbi:hypothetical protein niasHT_004292 [Heterodera trifolii]|uniref:Cyclic nucleotide-binding domain-containing protein n=1 Tax=Heterodera trifolii TaxID=157864 RepID=A0ABD2LNI2_9BILA
MAPGPSSAVEQKKSLFEAKCPSSPTRPQSPTALKRKNSSVEKSQNGATTLSNSNVTVAQYGEMGGEGPSNSEGIAVHGISKNPFTAPFASNFHRLSRIRLNMSRKLHPSNSVSSSSDAAAASSSHHQPNTLNVSIRHQSPHRHHQRHSGGRPRPGTPSSISLASNKAHGGCSSVAAVAVRTLSSSTTAADETDCFAGLPETVVDSDGASEGYEDEEDDDEMGSCPSHDSELRDIVRECLERPPDQRSAEDMTILIEFMDSLPTLAALPMTIKRQLSLKMVFAHVPNKGTVIMQNGERIDAWSVVVNGCVEHLHMDGKRTEYQVGDCFGAKPIAQPQLNDGEIRTMVNNCEFILVREEMENEGLIEIIMMPSISGRTFPRDMSTFFLVGDENVVGSEEVPSDSHFASRGGAGVKERPPSSSGSLRVSRSNPDISANSVHYPFALCSSAVSSVASHRHSSFSTNCGGGAARTNAAFGGIVQPLQMLKVYRVDQNFRYLPVLAETSAKQLMLMALQEFGLPVGENDGWWALYECSVSRDGVTKQGRLPDSAANLAERIGLNARLYLRDMRRSDESNLLPDGN